MKLKKTIFIFIMLYGLMLLVFSGCNSDNSPIAPENNGIEKNVDTTVVIHPDQNRGITLAVYDADKNSIAHMTIQYRWEGAEVMDADTVWQPPVVVAYQVGYSENGYKKVSAIKKKDNATDKFYWEAKFDVDVRKFNESNPVRLDAEVSFFVFNINLNVKVYESITYTAINKK